MARFPTIPADITKIDLSKIDLTAAGRDKVLSVVRDAAYVVVGFGVLTVQQVQVRRRELTAALSKRPVVKQLGISNEQLDELVAQIERRFAQLETKLDTIVDTIVDNLIDAVGDRLPEQASAMLVQARDVAKAARKQVRGLLVNAA